MLCSTTARSLQGGRHRSSSIARSRADRAKQIRITRATMSGGDDQQAGPKTPEEQGTRFSDLPLEEVRRRIAAFAAERDWQQYHTPRNLLLALVGEVGELSEIFQWRGDAAAGAGLPGFSPAERAHLGEELSDVLLYLVRLSDACGVDLSAAVLAKLEKNAAKYPAERCRGRADKYTAYMELKAEAAARSAGGSGDGDDVVVGGGGGDGAAAAAAPAEGTDG